MTLHRILPLLLVVLSLSASAQEETTLRLFDEVTFYDGYLFEKNPDKDLQDGILRHNTSLYAVRLTDEQLSLIGDSLWMNVTVKACCDNYDRIGNVNLAFVPKGATTYDPYGVKRIELGRFITPFMNKNKNPKQVPYAYDIHYVSHILRDAKWRADYDIWAELEIFGVPYAANQQVDGCEGRSDVFQGTLEWVTTQPAAEMTDKDVLVPIVMKKPEYMGHNLNNYSEAGTDTIGKTTKTYVFDVPEDVADAQLVIVTSNHGANEGGEEYNRRWHYIYVDDELMLSYKPGRTSCEPFRKYNTQPNGIYGWAKRSDKAWQSFSNWCPGDVIDNRIILLGAFPQGQHKVRISVPEAEFVDKQGDIPVSIFFQGLTEGTFHVGIDRPTIAPEEQQVNISMNGGSLQIAARETVINIELYDLQGRLYTRLDEQKPIDISRCPSGWYLVNVELANGIIETHKVLIKK